MMFYFIVLGSLVVNSCLSYNERQDFKLDDYEAESLRWKNPHSDVFGYSGEPVIDELSELSGTARGAVHSDKLHAAVEACHGRVQILSQQVRNNDILVQRFVKHLVRIYDETIDHHEGVIFMKITAEDMKALKSFADDGKFVSHSYNNIHDLLRMVLTVPSKSILDRILPMMNIFSKIWSFALYIFQEIRFLLMQIVLSADVVIYASMILPPVCFLYSLRKGHSVMAAVLFAGGAVALIAYFVELRSAIETARAKDLSRLARARNIPPECTGDTLGYYDWTISFFRSIYTSEDRCEKYFREQVPESSIEPSQVFWKIVFTPLTVAMEKFGQGLREFTSTFSKNLGWGSTFIILPIGIMALLYFLALLFSFVGGGSINLPFLGKVAFSNPLSRLSGPINSERPDQPSNNSTNQPSISNHYNFHFFNTSQPTLPEITCPTGMNMSISVPSGPTVQLASPPSSNIIPNSSGLIGQAVTSDNSGSSNESSGVSIVTTAYPGPSQSSTSSLAGSAREQQLKFSISETSHEITTNSARHPRLFSAFSETEYNRSVDSSTSVSNHCALKEIGSGDFLPRDLSHRMLPSGVLRWRHHHRKLSL